MAVVKKTKADRDRAKGIALKLYLKGETQKAIAGVVGITEATISKWVKTEGWEKEKKDQNTSPSELAGSMMVAAKKITQILIDKSGEKEINVEEITKLADNLVKIMASAERISETITQTTVIDVMILFEKWLMEKSETDPGLTQEFIFQINRYHKEYVRTLSTDE
ncbi:MAG: helix-turn-helix domain containing protein [Tannerellaceae bacterium]|nr:helix-turn-helix domain containing protein [Tannerellaceae bacterium]